MVQVLTTAVQTARILGNSTVTKHPSVTYIVYIYGWPNYCLLVSGREATNIARHILLTAETVCNCI